MEMFSTAWGSLCCLVPVFILRPPLLNPVLVSPLKQKAVAKPTFQIQVKNQCLAQGILCPTGCFPCSDGNLAGWLSLDNSGEGKVSSLLLLSDGRG